MIPQTQHEMFATPDHDEASRQEFVSDFRVHLASRVFPGNFPTYYNRVLPEFAKAHGYEPKTRQEVRKVMTKDPYYQLWSAMQRSSQEMIWDSVIDSVERHLPDLIQKAKQGKGEGSLTLNPGLIAPKYLTGADIHLQPGAYHSNFVDDDVAEGALYDRGTYIYSMGGMGPENDGLGRITYNFFKSQYPERNPERVLDMGCTIGGSVSYWALQEPNIEFHAVDIGAPVLRYGHARAKALGAAVHFSQQNAERTNFAENSFDIVTSHILLHETSKTALQKIFDESYRVLKPGGVMIHLDLPQAHGVPPLEAFLFEWEIYNNNEHFYGQLRDIDLIDVAKQAGFKKENSVTKFAGSTWMDDQTPYAEDGFEFPITIAVK